MRMDGRIEWTDLMMRMEYPGTAERDEQKCRNRLQQRMARMRERFMMVSWKDTAGENNSIRDRVLNKLGPAQLAARGGLGSTRGCTPGSTDGQGRVVPVPGRRPRGSGIAKNRGRHQQQPQTRLAPTVTSSTASQRQDPVTHQGFVAVNAGNHRPTLSHRGSGNRQQAVHSQHANTNGQQHWPSTSNGVFSGGNSVSTSLQEPYAQTSYMTNTSQQEYQFPGSYAAVVYETTLPVVGGRRSSNSAKTNEDYGSVDDDDEFGEEHVESGREGGIKNSDEGDKNGHGDIEEFDAKLPSVEEDSKMESLSPEVFREVQRYLEEDRKRIEMCLHGRISVDELKSSLRDNQARLKQGLKRARGDISDDDDEVEELQNRRAKRTRRGDDAQGSNDQAFSASQGRTNSGFANSQPGPWGEYHRQGALKNTSRRTDTRPVGSAIQRLHKDRLRRPAPKATQNEAPEIPCYPQPESTMGGEEHRLFSAQTDCQEPRYLSHQGYGFGNDDDTYASVAEPRPQRQPGGEMYSSVLNHTYSNDVGNTSGHASHGPPQGYSLPDARISSHTVEPARNTGAHMAPSGAYQQATAGFVQDDPFSSDEIFSGMPNHQSDNDHVGSMYSHVQQHKFNDSYRPVTMPGPRSGTQTDATTVPSPPLGMEESRPVFVADMLDPDSGSQVGQDVATQQECPPGTVPSVPVLAGGAPAAQAAIGASQPAEDSDLVVGDIAGWNPEWEAFVNEHDAEPLLRVQYPDDYPPGSPKSNE